MSIIKTRRTRFPSGFRECVCVCLAALKLIEAAAAPLKKNKYTLE